MICVKICGYTLRTDIINTNYGYREEIGHFIKPTDTYIENHAFESELNGDCNEMLMNLGDVRVLASCKNYRIILCLRMYALVYVQAC